MHIPDGFIDPKIAGGFAAGAAGVLAYAASKIKGIVSVLSMQQANATADGSVKPGRMMKVLSPEGSEYIMKIALIASLVFAMQMFNFSVNSGTSGHFLGGLFAALFLGPWGGAAAIAMVLAVQALFYADGGIAAFGANVFNMAVIGCIASFYIMIFLKKCMAKYPAVFISAWFSVVAAAATCALQIGFSGTYNLYDTLLAMIKVHVLIGLGEALLTICLYYTVKSSLGWKEYIHES